MKKDSHATDGTGFIFKEGLWYIVEQDQYGITILRRYYLEVSPLFCILNQNHLSKKRIN